MAGVMTAEGLNQNPPNRSAWLSSGISQTSKSQPVPTLQGQQTCKPPRMFCECKQTCQQRPFLERTEPELSGRGRRDNHPPAVNSQIPRVGREGASHHFTAKVIAGLLLFPQCLLWATSFHSLCKQKSDCCSDECSWVSRSVLSRGTTHFCQDDSRFPARDGDHS